MPCLYSLILSASASLASAICLRIPFWIVRDSSHKRLVSALTATVIAFVILPMACFRSRTASVILSSGAAAIQLPRYVGIMQTLCASNNRDFQHAITVPNRWLLSDMRSRVAMSLFQISDPSSGIPTSRISRSTSAFVGTRFTSLPSISPDLRLRFFHFHTESSELSRGAASRPPVAESDIETSLF